MKIDLNLLTPNGKVYINPLQITHVVKTEHGVEIYVSGHQAPVATLSEKNFLPFIDKVGGFSSL